MAIADVLTNAREEVNSILTHFEAHPGLDTATVFMPCSNAQVAVGHISAYGAPLQQAMAKMRADVQAIRAAQRQSHQQVGCIPLTYYYNSIEAVLTAVHNWPKTVH